MKNIIFKIKLFFYNLFHKRSLLNTKNIVCYLISEQLPNPLTLEEEEALLIARDNGDATAVEKLIEHNLRLVIFISKRFKGPNIEAEDIISIGSIGLIKAIKTFKIDKNIRLATYASRCIENEILMYLRKANKSMNDLSLDRPIHTDGEGNELCLSDIIPIDGDIVEQGIDKAEDKKVLFELLEGLNVRDQEIMIMRYGLGGQDELTQKEIAEKMNISQSYISRLEKRILVQMRKKYERQVL